MNVWPHLRQFIRVFELEKEIWRDISPGDIEEDIKILEEATIPDEHKKEIKERLERVLLLLKKGAEQNA